MHINHLLSIGSFLGLSLLFEKLTMYTFTPDHLRNCRVALPCRCSTFCIVAVGRCISASGELTDHLFSFIFIYSI